MSDEDGGGEDQTGLIYVSITGEEVWLLSQQDGSGPPDDARPVVDAFSTAVDR